MSHQFIITIYSIKFNSLVLGTVKLKTTGNNVFPILFAKGTD